MTNSLLTSTSPLALNERSRELERIRLMRSCGNTIAEIAHAQMQELATDRFVVLCVDIMPRWAMLMDELNGSDWRDALAHTAHPVAIIPAPHDACIDLAQIFPAQANGLKQLAPADKPKVIVLDAHGVTICFIDPMPIAAMKH